MDAVSKHLLRAGRTPLLGAPGRTARRDVADARGGGVTVFLCCAPRQAQRGTDVSAQRTTVEWAQQRKELVAVRYPHAARRVRVLDNVITHAPASLPASLYEAFAPAAAKRLAEKREMHDTPQPGRWLTSAESALRVLARQGLARRRPNLATLQAAVRAWPEQRKRTATPLDWRFTTQDARIKLKRLYPSSQE
jgi:hypothetical protein